MAKFDVHIYAVVRVPIRGVEAANQAEAIAKAEAQADLHAMFHDPNSEAEYAEEVSGYLVDEQGDEEYERSLFYDAQGKVQS